MYETSINGVLAARFLKHLQHTIDEQLLVIWDGSSIHRSRAVNDVLEQAQGPIWLERLPGYAPDLNPDEGVWQHLKNANSPTSGVPIWPRIARHSATPSAASIAVQLTSSPPASTTQDFRDFHAGQ